MPKSSPSPDAAASGPKPMQTAPLPESLGKGEVRLYDLRKTALPEVVNAPAEKDAAEWALWMVHFPSRRCAPVKGERDEALRLMKQFTRGVDETGLIPKPKGKPAPARARARKADKKSGGDGQAAPAGRMGFTAVPADLDFDKAMAHVFPVERITQQFERLLHATEVVYDREGKEVGERPAFTVQFQTLKALTEWHIGRPREKEKRVEVKPALSLSDLRRKMQLSPEYRAALRQMIDDAEQEAKQSAGVASAPAPMQAPGGARA